MKQQFNVGFCTFSYGGNGGISSEVPDIREWMTPLISEISRDERIENIRIWNLSDTPITMTRNRAVLMARQYGVDVLVMVDSDMKPDCEAGKSGVKPFFQSSFDFLVKHYHKGPVCIGAPYCGPPPVECVYVFRWQNMQSNNPQPDFQLEMYDRHTAVKMQGIQECAALPTGLIMYDMRVFELTEPKDEKSHPWFYYEWKDKYAAEKASTEDVTMTRDLSLVGATKLGYNPVFCNWDAWAGHWKPKCVGKPVVLDAAGVGGKLKDAWASGHDSSAKIIDLQAAPEFKAILEKAEQPFDGMGMELPDQDVAALHRMIQYYRNVFGNSPTVLEIGSWAGRSAIEMCKAGARSVHCVDTWEGNTHDNGTKQYDGSRGKPIDVFRKNIAGYPITYTKGLSPEVESQFADKMYDIVYIDAEHTWTAVKQDILAWAKHARQWVAGHDYHVFVGVRTAIRELGLTPTVDSNVWRVNAKDLHRLQEVVPGN